MSDHHHRYSLVPGRGFVSGDPPDAAFQARLDAAREARDRRATVALRYRPARCHWPRGGCNEPADVVLAGFPYCLAHARQLDPTALPAAFLPADEEEVS